VSGKQDESTLSLRTCGRCIFCLRPHYLRFIAAIFWRYAVSKPELLAVRVKPQVIQSMDLRILISPLVCLATICLAFVDVTVATYIIVLIPLFYLSHRKVDTAIEKEN
jgi:hypothetical protein